MLPHIFCFPLVPSLPFFLLFPAFAACTPSPDCASLGYTAASCPNGGVKCPFDTSKWHCNEDVCAKNGFIYSCTGTGFAGGSGASCNSKYSSCSCASGYAWKDGTCKSTLVIDGYCCGGSCWSADDSWCKSFHGKSCLNVCLENHPSCTQIQANCRSVGKTPAFFRCQYIDWDHTNYGGSPYKADEYSCN